MDNTDGAHVIISRLVDGNDGLGHFEDATVPYDQALGPLRQSTVIDASSIAFWLWSGDFVGDFSHSPAARIVLILEGVATVYSGAGESRDFKPGDVLELAQRNAPGPRIQAADAKPFRAAIMDLGKGPNTAPLGHGLRKADQTLPFVRNVTGEDQRSHFLDLELAYYHADNGALVTDGVAITRFQYVYAASDLRYDFHNAPQRQIVLPLTGGTQGQNGDGSRRVIPQGGVYFGEDTTGEGHITSAVNDAIRYSIFAHLA
ncbi:MAG: hypothetical protein P8N43_14245 [Alphaproteobacteria bacterium]|nr:hypothetical protein [Alphaproteobacteria bacterium]